MQEAIDFIDSFELVFGLDWDYTKEQLQDPLYLHPRGTFLHPYVKDEANNWGNRGALLECYRHLKAKLNDEKPGIKTIDIPTREVTSDVKF